MRYADFIAGRSAVRHEEVLVPEIPLPMIKSLYNASP